VQKKGVLMSKMFNTIQFFGGLSFSWSRSEKQNIYSLVLNIGIDFGASSSPLDLIMMGIVVGT
jgi:hypothetical protein